MKNEKYIRILFSLIWLASCRLVAADDPTNSVPLKPDLNTYWGAETNGIKAGLYVEKKADDSSLHFMPLLYNSRTNNGNIEGAGSYIALYLPPFNSRYAVELTDEKGKLVPKTAKGKALGAPLTKRLRVTEGINFGAGYGRGGVLVAGEIYRQPSGAFSLQDYFEIKNSGKYHLRFKTFVFIPRDYKDEFVQFPPVDVDVEVKLKK